MHFPLIRRVAGISRRPFLPHLGVLPALIGLFLMASVAWSAEVRVATYNIKFLSTNVQQRGPPDQAAAGD